MNTRQIMFLYKDFVIDWHIAPSRRTTVRAVHWKWVPASMDKHKWVPASTNERKWVPATTNECGYAQTRADGPRDTLILVFSYVSLEDVFLDEILQVFVCEVDAEWVKGVGVASHRLDRPAGKTQVGANECGWGLTSAGGDWRVQVGTDECGCALTSASVHWRVRVCTDERKWVPASTNE